MATVGKRIEEIVRDLSPEDKARLVLEDVFRPAPVLSPGDRRKLLAALSDDEARRYNAVTQRYQILESNIDTLRTVAQDIKEKLLEWDRILWYRYALQSLEEGIVYGSAAAPLLTKNPNLKTGQSLQIEIPLATFQLGVWGKRTRTPSPEMVAQS